MTNHSVLMWFVLNKELFQNYGAKINQYLYNNDLIDHKVQTINTRRGKQQLSNILSRIYEADVYEH